MTDILKVTGFDSRSHGKTKAPADPEKLKKRHIFLSMRSRIFAGRLDYQNQREQGVLVSGERSVRY